MFYKLYNKIIYKFTYVLQKTIEPLSHQHCKEHAIHDAASM